MVHVYMCTWCITLHIYLVVHLMFSGVSGTCVCVFSGASGTCVFMLWMYVASDTCVCMCLMVNLVHVCVHGSCMCTWCITLHIYLVVHVVHMFDAGCAPCVHCNKYMGNC